MRTPWLTTAAVVALALLPGHKVQAQYQAAYYQPQLYNNPNQAYQFERFYYYPYYYFPHNYWPVTGPRWPEAPTSPTCGHRPTWPSRRSTSRTGVTSCGNRRSTIAVSTSGWTSSSN